MDASGALIVLVVFGAIIIAIWTSGLKTKEREQSLQQIARRGGLEPDFLMEYNSVGAGGAEGEWYHTKNDKIAFAIYRKHKLMRVIFNSNKSKPLPFDVRFDEIVDIEQRRMRMSSSFDVTIVITTNSLFPSIEVFDPTSYLYRNLRSALGR
jgi:hypothetical protein